MKFNLNFFFLFSTVLLLMIVSSTNVSACSCMRTGTVDTVFETTPNVVIMKLRSVEKYAEGEKGQGSGGIKQSKLTVEKVFKGTLKVGQEITFAQGGGADCVWTFSEGVIGVEFLFYLGAKPVKPGLWVAGTCSRSNSIKGAAVDLLYIDNLERVKGKTRLSGTVTQAIESATEGEQSSYGRLANRHVLVIGNGQSVRLKTNSDGVFEVYDLPPGKYKITPEKIDGFIFDKYTSNESIEVEVKAKSHTEQSFWFYTRNRIAGKFYDTSGKPLKNVCLRLRPAEGKESRGFFEMDCTEADGSFVMDEIPTGSYVLVINEDGKVTSDQPFGKFYYPAAKRREDASEITISPGIFLDDLIITAPETAETITISGYVMLDDGKRASKANLEHLDVEFLSDKGDKTKEYRQADARVDVDENGRFNIRILKGDKGLLLASLMTFSGEFENCPRLEKLIKASGSRIPDIKSQGVRIDAINDLGDVELKLPFPTCKRRIIE
jgi:hypothetical protein